MKTNRLTSLVLSITALACASCAPPPSAPPPAAPMPSPPRAAALPMAANGAVPPQLQPPPSAVPILRATAHGFQIYTCSAKPGAGFAWSFKAPEALLNDFATGRVAAKHFAGPTWQAIPDGSMVVGDAIASVPAPNGIGVPWLLLRARTHQGAGVMSTVSFIQRLDTSGGLAPAGGCDPAYVGQEARIPYTATYLLYR